MTTGTPEALDRQRGYRNLAACYLAMERYDDARLAIQGAIRIDPDYAGALHGLGVEILSTGGTARLLADAGIPVVEVSDYTGFPEMMDGRVKTLHPKVHGGILGRRGTDEAVMAEHDIPPIDLVVVNLYPFEQTVAREVCDLPLAIDHFRYYAGVIRAEAGEIADLDALEHRDRLGFSTHADDLKFALCSRRPGKARSGKIHDGVHFHVGTLG